MNNYQGEFMSGSSEKKYSYGKFVSSETDLSAELKSISQKCIKCNLCVKECEFLRRYGKPGEIAGSIDLHKNPDLSIAFKCSLCRLCNAVCPVDIDPSKMFLEMRRVSAAQGKGTLGEHKGILAYERRGLSKRYSWYGLPEGCETVFFPGCTLPGTRPATTLAVFKRLRRTMPSLGIVLGCCANISHDLGRQEFFQAKFHEMRRLLIQRGVRNVITACPSCYNIFDQYGEGFNTKSVYEILSEEKIEKTIDNQGAVVIHDPCALRFNTCIQDAVRDLINSIGFETVEMPHSRWNTFCCGEGGSVRHLSPDLSTKWAIARSNETDNKRVVTCCAGCVNHLSKSMSVCHILDLVFNSEATLSGKAKVSKAPMTYLNRIWLKRRLKKMLKAVENVVTLNEVKGL
jgi:Fe-S oxidoreductase